MRDFARGMRETYGRGIRCAAGKVGATPDEIPSLASKSASGLADAMPLEVNRAPVLTLWAAVVAERLGHPADTALTLGRAVAGSAARVKARNIGCEERKADRDADRPGLRPDRVTEPVFLLGKTIRLLPTTDGQLRVEVDAFPTHRDLQHAVQLAQGAARGHQYAPPHHRADAKQPHLDLYDRVRVRRGRRKVLCRQRRLRLSRRPERLLPHFPPVLSTPQILMLPGHRLPGAWSLSSAVTFRPPTVFHGTCEAVGVLAVPHH